MSPIDSCAQLTIESGMDYYRAVMHFRAAWLRAALDKYNGNLCLIAREHKLHRNTVARIRSELGKAGFKIAFVKHRKRPVQRVQEIAKSASA